MYFREFLNLFRAGRVGQGKEPKARRKNRRRKRGRGGRGVWGRPEAERSSLRGKNSAAPEPKSRSCRINSAPAALLVQSRAQQKSFLFLLEGKIGRAQIKNAKKTFLRGGERQRAAAGRSVSFAQKRFAQSLE